METIIGYAAAATGISIAMPQIIKTIRTKKVSDISVSMWLLLSATQILWFTYAVMRDDFILALNNAIVFGQDMVMLYLIHRYRR